MGDASQGAQARLLAEPGASPHSFDSSSEAYDFLYETVAKQGRIIGGNGIRGTRSDASERTRAGASLVAGRIGMYLDPLGLDSWLPRILGAAESSDVFAVAETLPAFGLLIDRVAEIFEYTDCKVNRAIFQGRSTAEGGDEDLILLTLEVIGKTEVVGTSWPGTPPSIATGANAAPYRFCDGVLTAVSSSREFFDFALVVDNHLDVRFANSCTPTSITPRGRTVMLRVTTPYTSDETDLYAQAAAGATGTLVLTNGGVSTTFTFGVLQVPDNSPTVPGKREIPLVMDMVARSVGSTKEIEVTNDSVA